MLCCCTLPVAVKYPSCFPIQAIEQVHGFTSWARSPGEMKQKARIETVRGIHGDVRTKGSSKLHKLDNVQRQFKSRHA